jgi:hypothetical protein
MQQAKPFHRLRAGGHEPIHPTPGCQKLICLAGAVRLIASDGEARNITTRNVWHMEDRHGKGHHTKVNSTEDFEAIIIQYD